jgi:eukaryotic-like serine/threonine-protein kinase
MSKSVPTALTPGSVIAGRYRVEEVLGQGGMGVVVKATHLQLNRPVAVKMLLSNNPHGDLVDRFTREAQVAFNLQSEHVVRVLDFGATEDGNPYLAMEFLTGEDLAQVLHRLGRLPFGEVIALVSQACEGLAEAHARGIVHRDLKPANLFLTRKANGAPLIKVLDFGIAKVLDQGESSALTSTMTMLGTVVYMSPEQIRSSKQVDARTDIWAMGVILHELLSGLAPFGGDTSTAVLASIIQDTPPSLSPLVPDLPEGLASVVLRCLSKPPQDRYATVTELCDALRAFAGPMPSGGYPAPRIEVIPLSGRPQDFSAVGETTQVPYADLPADSRPPTPAAHPTADTQASWETLKSPSERPSREQQALSPAPATAPDTARSPPARGVPWFSVISIAIGVVGLSVGAFLGLRGKTEPTDALASSADVTPSGRAPSTAVEPAPPPSAPLPSAPLPSASPEPAASSPPPAPSASVANGNVAATPRPFPQAQPTGQRTGPKPQGGSPVPTTPQPQTAPPSPTQAPAPLDRKF